MPFGPKKARKNDFLRVCNDWNFHMALTMNSPFEDRDLLCEQAQKILAQRQARAQVIDRDLLGEPGWDILLCAFIANRKQTACPLSDVAQTIDLSIASTQRWADALTQRGYLHQREGLIAISEDAEAKLAGMFRKQLAEIMQAFGSG